MWPHALFLFMTRNSAINICLTLPYVPGIMLDKDNIKMNKLKGLS